MKGKACRAAEGEKGRRRERLHQLQLFWPELARHLLLRQERPHLFEPQWIAVLQDYTRTTDLTQACVRQPHHRDFLHRGMAQQRLLDLRRIDVDPAAQDQIGGAARNRYNGRVANARSENKGHRQ